jgi:hypothetical protein
MMFMEVELVKKKRKKEGKGVNGMHGKKRR